jgi:ABC-type sugar transport system ATPase subunit
MSSTPTTLAVKSLSRVFGQTVAVAGVTFETSTSEVVALAGGNGSGKTTLLKMIAGALLPDGGYVEWSGHRLTAGNPHKTRLEGIEMVFQDGALCPDRSVLENLFLGRERLARFGFLASGDMRRLAIDMIERSGFRIPGLDITPKQLSGGQQKAIAIGRALLSRPRLLLLDEPTAALGVKEPETTLRTIGELNLSSSPNRPDLT